MGEEAGVRIRISGAPGTDYALEASDDLRTWRFVDQGKPIQAEVDYATGLEEPARFYRVCELVTE